MKRLFSRLGPVVLLTLSAAARGESSVNVTIGTDRGVSTCGDVRIRYDHREAARSEDSFTMAATAARPVAGPARTRLHRESSRQLEPHGSKRFR
jgi:hypothetical protein